MASQVNAYPHVFSPLKVGHLVLKSRVFIPGHQPGLAENGLVSDRYIAYHRARARAGAAMQITGRTNITHANRLSSSGALLANVDDGAIPGFQRLAEAVHAEGGRMLSQLGHSGPALFPGANTQPVLGPSRFLSSMYLQVAKPMDRSEIDRMTNAYVEAAERCRRADLDGIEIMVAAGQLLASFLSPLTNHREDEWGGTLDNRVRLPLRIIHEIRTLVGRDFVVGVRLMGDELVEGGIDSEEACRIAQVLVATGEIDYLSIIPGTNVDRLSRVEHWAPTPAPHGRFRHLAAAVKRAVGDFPVACVGRITDMTMAEDIIAQGEADLVGMVRANIADPDLIAKAREGRESEIRPCIGLNVCVNNIMVGKTIQCLVNPEVGREEDWPSKPAHDAAGRRAVVVGAGPAGLEAARVLSLRGADVILVDEHEAVGGQMLRWSAVKSRREVRRQLDWWVRSLVETKVDLRLGHKMTSSELLELQPEYVVIATGSIPAPSQLPVGGNHILEIDPLDACDGSAAGGTAVVVDSFGRIDAGLVAERLSESFSRVILVTSCFVIGEGEGATTIYTMLRRIAGLGVEILERTRVEGVDGHTLQLRGIFGEHREPISNVDVVVPLAGGISVNDLADSLKEAGVPARVVGDALSPRRAHEAVLEGAAAARAIWTKSEDMAIFAM